MPIGNAFAILKSVKIKVPTSEIFVSNINVSNLACDSNNNIYFSADNNIIGKVDQNKNVTEFAKIEIAAPDISAGIAKPNITHMSFDSTDALYFGDNWNIIGVGDIAREAAYHFIIRKITQAKVVTDVVTAGSTRGVLIRNNLLYFTTSQWNGSKFVGEMRRFNLDTKSNDGIIANMARPSGIAINSGENIYVSDFSTHTIRSQFAFYAGRNDISGYFDGNNLTTNTFFNTPRGLCFDKYDNMYIADSGNNSIRKITKAGSISTLIGNTRGNSVGSVSNTKLSNPTDVIMGKDGYLYIADNGNACIKKVDLNLP